MPPLVLIVVLLSSVVLSPPVHGQARLDVDWEDFLSRADLLWTWNVQNGWSIADHDTRR